MQLRLQLGKHHKGTYELRTERKIFFAMFKRGRIGA